MPGQGDLVFADPDAAGIVVIPRDKIDKLAQLCSKRTVAIEKVMLEVDAGGNVLDAYKKYEEGV